MILTLQKLIQKSKQVTDPRDVHALALDKEQSFGSLFTLLHPGILLLGILFILHIQKFNLKQKHNRR